MVGLCAEDRRPSGIADLQGFYESAQAKSNLAKSDGPVLIG